MLDRRGFFSWSEMVDRIVWADATAGKEDVHEER